MFFREEIKLLLSGEKLGHLASYHYGEPLCQHDKVNGAALWDKFIKYSDCYYQFKSENSVLPVVAEFINGLLGKKNISLVDLGPGSDTSFQEKTIPFLSAIQNIESYIPVDLCAEYLKEAKKTIECRFPSLSTSVQQKNYFNQPVNFNVNSTPIFLFFNSISNLPEIPLKGCYKFHLSMVLQHLYDSMQCPGYLIVSQDTNQDEHSLLEAYGDPNHVAFSLNILERMKRDAIDDGCRYFDPAAWIYRPEWYPEKSLLTHNLYSTDHQLISLQGREYFVPKGKKLTVDNSYKYKSEDFLRICETIGFSPVKTFMDKSGKIAVHVLERG